MLLASMPAFGGTVQTELCEGAEERNLVKVLRALSAGARVDVDCELMIARTVPGNVEPIWKEETMSIWKVILDHPTKHDPPDPLVVKALLQESAQIQQPLQPALELLLWSELGFFGNSEVESAKLILEAGADANLSVTDKWLWHYGHKAGRPMISALVAAGLKLERHDFAPVLAQAAQKAPQYATDLVNLGFPVNQVYSDDFGRPTNAIHETLRAQDYTAAEHLVELGAQPIGPMNASLVHIALDRDESATLAWVVEQPWADVSQTDEEGLPALHRAVRSRRWEKAGLLAPKNAEVVDSSGNTPLFDAIRQRNAQGISWLLKQGASSKTQDAEGRSVFQVLMEVADPASMQAALSEGLRPTDQGNVLLTPQNASLYWPLAEYKVTPKFSDDALGFARLVPKDGDESAAEMLLLRAALDQGIKCGVDELSALFEGEYAYAVDKVFIEHAKVSKSERRVLLKAAKESAPKYLYRMVQGLEPSQ